MWAGAWAPRAVTVADVTCATCGKVGVRLVAEGEAVAGEPVYCQTCDLERTSPAGQIEDHRDEEDGELT